MSLRELISHGKTDYSFKTLFRSKLTCELCGKHKSIDRIKIFGRVCKNCKSEILTTISNDSSKLYNRRYMKND